ncbi:hypothetical protein UA08_05099 [Talaromyces atroroseus]|uniref:C2H2-type domain-containing protein n=1 Tax=Talaromyces atroroseus TaxID=1441469 RepID=A0A225AWI1_TALAT|nr:hypothetical protein UA08_05099 [Talaromyces atroroseus]OKL59316.1 hypothetical protein UA08_05099 [Talaromyces atroroseus]
MPWHAHSCPFCHKQHANKDALHTHLEQYVSEWRIPADGAHDVLEIHKILHAGDSNHGKQYKCPECLKVIDTQKHFIAHVYYRKHYGKYLYGFEQGIKGRCQQGSWPLPFDEEAALIPQRKGVFNFLGLPYDLRHMIYEFALVFGEIVFLRNGVGVPVEPNQQGLWLQHNPKSNPLSLLIVNRQIYDEGRRLFYSRNSFVFDSPDIPVFLIAISRSNAMLLREVRSEDESLHQDRTGLIRDFWVWEKEDGSQTDIWSDDEACGKLVEALESDSFCFARHPRRLLHLNSDRLSPNDIRKRYNFNVVLGRRRYENGREAGIGKASFELYAGL